MSVIVLHLSDLHIRSGRDPILKRAPEIARATYSSLPRASAVIVVVSGDIAFSGKKEQYDAALGFFEALRAEIQLEQALPVHFIPCPGNHDCDFSMDDSIRKIVLTSLQTKGAAEVDDSIINTCVRVQEEYLAFAAKLTSDIEYARGDTLWKSFEFSIEGKTLTFDAINVAWASQLHEEQGTLSFPHERYESKTKEPTVFALQCCISL